MAKLGQVILNVSARSVEGHRGVARGLFDDSLDVLCVEDVYSAKHCESICERLETAPLSGLRTAREHRDPQRPQVEVIGEPISPSSLYPEGPDPSRYFGASAGVATRVAELFAPEESFPTRAIGLLGTLLDRPVERPSTASGLAYGAATLRRVPPDCGLGLHRENLYQHIAVLEELRGLADLPRVLSVFLVLGVPEGGGELRVFGEDRADVDVPRAVARPDVGTLVVFAGGRRFHDVAPVTGTRARWTIGGFAAPAADPRRAYFWG